MRGALGLVAFALQKSVVTSFLVFTEMVRVLQFSRDRCGDETYKSKSKASGHERWVKGQCSAESQCLGLQEGEQGFLAGESCRSELLRESLGPGWLGSRSEEALCWPSSWASKGLGFYLALLESRGWKAELQKHRDLGIASPFS